MRTRHMWRALLTAAAVVALTTACTANSPRDVASIKSGSPGVSGPAAGPGAPDDFTRCLKEHGVGLVPVQDGQDSGTVTFEPPSAEEQRKQQEATEQCRQFLPSGELENQPMNPEQLEQARAVAKCMRAAGVQYPDPDPNVGGGNGAMPIPPGVDLADPAVRAKLDTCSRQAGVAGGGAGAGK